MVTKSFIILFGTNSESFLGNKNNTKKITAASRARVIEGDAE